MIKGKGVHLLDQWLVHNKLVLNFSCYHIFHFTSVTMQAWDNLFNYQQTLCRHTINFQRVEVVMALFAKMSLTFGQRGLSNYVKKWHPTCWSTGSIYLVLSKGAIATMNFIKSSYQIFVQMTSWAHTTAPPRSAAGCQKVLNFTCFSFLSSWLNSLVLMSPSFGHLFW